MAEFRNNMSLVILFFLFIDFFFYISTMCVHHKFKGCEQREEKSALKVNRDTNICKRLPKVSVSIGKWVLADPE